jgi:hypothetical protein
MPTTALYRKSSNEVVKISAVGQTFDDRDSNYWGILTDPTTPDGTEVRETLANTRLGPLRVLGFAKIAEPGSNNIRNAIQAEIDTFAAAETDDNDQLDADQTGSLLENHPMWRKYSKALLKTIIEEVLENGNVKINEMVSQWNQFKADTATASNLAQLQASVAALPEILPDLNETATVAQALSKIKAKVNKAD